MLHLTLLHSGCDIYRDEVITTPSSSFSPSLHSHTQLALFFLYTPITILTNSHSSLKNSQVHLIYIFFSVYHNSQFTLVFLSTELHPTFTFLPLYITVSKGHETVPPLPYPQLPPVLHRGNTDPSHPSQIWSLLHTEYPYAPGLTTGGRGRRWWEGDYGDGETESEESVRRGRYRGGNGR